jgi:hypothetical protein
MVDSHEGRGQLELCGGVGSGTMVADALVMSVPPPHTEVAVDSRLHAVPGLECPRAHPLQPQRFALSVG